MSHPARTPRRTSLALVAVSLCLSAGACSSGGDDTSSDEDTSSAAPSSASTSASVSASNSTSATASAPTSGTTPLTDDQVTPALLAPEDIGGYEFVAATPSDDDTPPPCADPGSPTIDEQVPPQASGSTELDGKTVDAVIVQDIQVYDSPALAAQAFALLVDGLSCTDGDLGDGTAVKIKPAQDVTAQVNADGVGESTAWQFSNAQIDGVVVATLSESVATDVVFIKAKDVDESQLPNPLQVSKIAFHKLLTH